MSETVRFPGIPLPLLALGVSVLGGVFGAGVTYASIAQTSAELTKQQTTLQAQVNDHFSILEKAREQRIQVVNARLDSVAAIAAARMDNVDHRDEGRADRIGALDTRITRLEAQLAYMMQLNSGAKR